MERDDQPQEDIGGFFDIFGDSGIAAEEAAEPEPDVAEPSRSKRTAAEASAPEEESDEDDLTADERVAANFAAIEDELGLETEEPEEEEDQFLGTEGPDLTDLSKLTREQLEALASESMGLKEKQQTLNEAEVVRAVQEAEHQAVQQVRQAFEEQIRTPAYKHYDAQFADRLVKILRNSANSEAFERDVVVAAQQLYRHMVNSEVTYQDQQADAWEDRLERAKLEARKSVPALRQVYARTLLESNNLPTTEQAISAVLKTKSGRERATDDFQDRIAELVEMRDRYARLQTQNTEKVRAEGKRRIAATAPKTSTAVRAKSRKPVAYKGEAEEGIRLLASMREG